jgi:glycosyltransferase involved in cell wall biosynthesis
MKILMIAPTPFFSDRGCHIRVLNSYLRLKREKNKITLITYPLGRDIKGINTKRIIGLPGYKKTSPGFSFYKPFLDFFLLIKCFSEMKSKKYDLVYAHLHEGALIGIILKKFFKKGVVFDAQGSLVGELTAQGTIKKSGFLKKIIFGFEKYITKNVDEIITSTDALKDFIVKEIGPKAPIKVIKDLPDKSLFNKNIKLAKLKLPKNKKIVVYLGGLQKYKGIDYLIKAIPLVDKQFHFLIMGYPVEYAKDLAKKLRVEKRITFTGKIPYEKAPSYLKLGNIAISPKTLESGEANAKLYNYLAMGLRVVCFDSQENRQILKNSGIYAQHGDYKDLAKKINETIQ